MAKESKQKETNCLFPGGDDIVLHSILPVYKAMYL